MYENTQGAPSAEQIQAGTAALEGIFRRSTTDPEFRQLLITDPRTAMARYAGKDVSAIPAGFNVVFIERRGDATYVLPDVVDAAAELSAEELEAVAGGTSPSCWSIVASCLAIINAIVD